MRAAQGLRVGHVEEGGLGLDAGDPDDAAAFSLVTRFSTARLLLTLVDLPAAVPQERHEAVHEHVVSKDVGAKDFAEFFRLFALLGPHLVSVSSPSFLHSQPTLIFSPPLLPSKVRTRRPPSDPLNQIPGPRACPHHIRQHRVHRQRPIQALDARDARIEDDGVEPRYDRTRRGGSGGKEGGNGVLDAGERGQGEGDVVEGDARVFRGEIVTNSIFLLDGRGIFAQAGDGVGALLRGASGEHEGEAEREGVSGEEGGD